MLVTALSSHDAQKGPDVTKADSDPTDLGEDSRTLFFNFNLARVGEDEAVDVIWRREQVVDSHLKGPAKKHN